MLAQVVILGSQILGKAFVQAWKQAARSECTLDSLSLPSPTGDRVRVCAVKLIHLGLLLKMRARVNRSAVPLRLEAQVPTREAGSTKSVDNSA